MKQNEGATAQSECHLRLELARRVVARRVVARRVVARRVVATLENSRRVEDTDRNRFGFKGFTNRLQRRSALETRMMERSLP
jgi:hypothetical protein